MGIDRREKGKVERSRDPFFVGRSCRVNYFFPRHLSWCRSGWHDIALHCSRRINVKERVDETVVKLKIGKKGEMMVQINEKGEGERERAGNESNWTIICFE